MKGQIGARIRQLREKQGMTLSDLSRLSNISRGYLHLIEKEESSPTYEKLLAIAEVLGVLVSELTGEINNNEDLPDVPASLQKYAQQRNLPPTDVIMLSKINYRGQKPQTSDDWHVLYTVIKGTLDKD